MNDDKENTISSNQTVKKSPVEELLGEAYEDEKTLNTPNIHSNEDNEFSTNIDPINIDDESSIDSERSYDGISITRKGSLKDDDIEGKKGNYIISFGKAGSGKTVFQSFLIYYLTHSGRFSTNLVISPEDTAIGWDGQRLYNEWISTWQNGDFPKGTDAKEESIKELTVSVKPKIGNCEEVNISFLEIAGELMEKIIPADERNPELITTLVRYFQNQNIKFTFLLFVDPKTARVDDILFDNLFTFIRINFPDLINSMSLGVVISKPEESLGVFKKNFPGYGHYVEIKGDLCEDYIERMTPRLYQTFNSWEPQNRVQIMTMSLGEVEVNNETNASILVRKNYHDIERIFAWLYNQITGQKLGLNWWQKLLKWLQE